MLRLVFDGLYNRALVNQELLLTNVLSMYNSKNTYKIEDKYELECRKSMLGLICLSYKIFPELFDNDRRTLVKVLNDDIGFYKDSEYTGMIFLALVLLSQSEKLSAFKPLSPTIQRLEPEYRMNPAYMYRGSN